jgi:hypothetical protein
VEARSESWWDALPNPSCGKVNRIEQVLVALADGHPTIANSIMYSLDTCLINAVPGYASLTGIASLL